VRQQYSQVYELLHVQERLAALRAKAQLEDLHDSTLSFDAEKAKKLPKELEEERKRHLKNFVEGLETLKGATGGSGLPGFDTSFLKDPRLASVSPMLVAHTTLEVGTNNMGSVACQGVDGDGSISHTKSADFKESSV
jgi:hypothetical protein